MSDQSFQAQILAIAKKHCPGSDASVELAFEEWLRDALEEAFGDGARYHAEENRQRD